MDRRGTNSDLPFGGGFSRLAQIGEEFLCTRGGTPRQQVLAATTRLAKVVVPTIFRDPTQRYHLLTPCSRIQSVELRRLELPTS